ncbi:MAG: hypothetical protein H6865_00285 [Rhodospirillales bacterium]|nr:hypothetical protein [Alphaproteobacteria bacterium]MCB9986063.1 hypothetical protein [Rhodospirillales bacterium]USO07368.1 MAG: hypothetical protein H6866_08090 [Rhodospirillales bacterium]
MNRRLMAGLAAAAFTLATGPVFAQEATPDTQPGAGAKSIPYALTQQENALGLRAYVKNDRLIIVYNNISGSCLPSGQEQIVGNLQIQVDVGDPVNPKLDANGRNRYFQLTDDYIRKVMSEIAKTPNIQGAIANAPVTVAFMQRMIHFSQGLGAAMNLQGGMFEMSAPMPIFVAPGCNKLTSAEIARAFEEFVARARGKTQEPSAPRAL